MKNLILFVSVTAFFALPAVAQARPVRLSVAKFHVEKKGARPSAKAVKAKLVRGLKEIKVCVASAVKKHRKYDGWLWLNFNFTGAGRIYGVAATSTLANPFIIKCVGMTLRHWTMPKGGGGKVTSSIQIRR
ncbi:MAG: hypothetical protein J7M25_04445 [Deltaproteobacteria bacterium]|nr:hypothetical protein [Deltaproteobacteria bacterium]